MSPTCACGNPASAVCHWKVWRFVRMLASELIIGEQIRRWSEDKPRSAKRAFVTAVIPSKNADLFYVKFDIHPVNPRGIIMHRTECISMAKAERLVTCDRSTCEACGVDRGGICYCIEHWNAWERVA